VEIEEQHVFGWQIICRALCSTLNRQEEEIRAHFKPLWDGLNKYAHPSAKQMDLVAEKDFSSLVTDSFDESLARELLVATDKVFDIVYAVVLKRFSKAKSLALQYQFLDECEECLPNTVSIIRH
jgi:hypothetical protein